MLHMATHSDENTTSSTLAARSALISSPIERSVADFLLATGPRAGAMSAREIAQAVGTSDATVIRTSRSLGFDGFRDLRRFVASQTPRCPSKSDYARVSMPSRIPMLSCVRISNVRAGI